MCVGGGGGGGGNLLRLHVTVLEAAVEPMEYKGLDGLVSFNDLASSSSSSIIFLLRSVFSPSYFWVFYLRFGSTFSLCLCLSVCLSLTPAAHPPAPNIPTLM